MLQWRSSEGMVTLFIFGASMVKTMTDNKEMTIEDALYIAMQWLDYGQYQKGSDNAKQASAVLRQIGEQVERVSKDKCLKCQCGKLSPFGTDWCECGSLVVKHGEICDCVKHWTETQVLKRVIEKSEAVYEPVKSEE